MDNNLLDTISMLLSTYLERKKISPGDFAQRVGVSAEAVRLYLNGKRIPRTRTMEKISEVTDGKVQPNDFFSVRGARAASGSEAA